MSLRALTGVWVSRYLKSGEVIVNSETMHGGMTAEMQKLTVGVPGERTRHVVLRSYVKPLALQHAEDWLNREIHAFKLLQGTSVAAPEFIAADPLAEHCENPSLLMTHLPGQTVLDDRGLDARIPLLARELVAIHALKASDRPREYESLTTAETVVIPASANDEAWAAAIDVIRSPAPPYDGRVLHRDFQPGNVLFDLSTARSSEARLTGVVDWAGASWGPADLDVAHCSTNLALLHGPEWGLRFAAAYEEAGGKLAATAQARQYWRVRDGLACSEEVRLWAEPWREAGRKDLTSRAVEDRLDAYITILMSADN